MSENGHASWIQTVIVGLLVALFGAGFSLYYWLQYDGEERRASKLEEDNAALLKQVEHAENLVDQAEIDLKTAKALREGADEDVRAANSARTAAVASALLARKQADISRYAVRLLRAEGAIRAKRYSDGLRELERCGSEQRGWEHDYLSRQCQRAKLAVKDATPVLTSVAFSPAGVIASGTYGGTIILWDAVTGEIVETLKGHTDKVVSVAFDRAGRILASGSLDGTVKIWTVRARRVGRNQRIVANNSATIKEHAAAVNCVAVDPNGRFVASASDDGTVKICDARRGRLQATLRGHSGHVFTVAFSSNGKVASAGADATVRLWTTAGKELQTLQEHTKPVYSVAFSPNGQYVASGGVDRSVRVWSVQTGTASAPFLGHKESVSCADYSPDGKRIVSTDDAGAIRVWDAVTGKELATLDEHEGRVNGVAFSNDGTTIASVGGTGASGDGMKTSERRTWNATLGEPVRTLTGHTLAVRCVDYGADGKHVVSAGMDQSLKIWDAATGRVARQIDTRTGPIDGVALSADGTQVAVGSRDRNVHVYRTADLKEIAVLEGHEFAVNSVAFHPDGKRLASGSLDGTVRLWDLATKAAEVLKGHTGSVLSVAYTPDGKHVVSASIDKTVRVWNSATKETVLELVGYHEPVLCVAVSGDGKRIAAGGADGTVRIWDGTIPENGGAVERNALTTITGHFGAVWSICFSADGRRILSGGDDGRIVVLDAATGHDLLVLTGHKGTVRSVAFSGDGKRVVSGGDDATVRTWDGDYAPTK